MAMFLVPDSRTFTFPCYKVLPEVLVLIPHPCSLPETWLLRFDGGFMTTRWIIQWGSDLTMCQVASPLICTIFSGANIVTVLIVCHVAKLLCVHCMIRWWLRDAQWIIHWHVSVPSLPSHCTEPYDPVVTPDGLSLCLFYFIGSKSKIGDTWRII